KRRPSGGSCRRAAAEVVDRMTRIWVEEREVKLERIVFTEVRRKSAVFKPVIEHSKSAAHDELWTRLVCEAESRRKVLFLSLYQALAKFAAYELNAVRCEQVYEAR